MDTIFKKENSLLLMFSSFQLLYQFSVNIVIPFFSIILLSSGWSEENITYFFSIATFTVFLLAPTIGKLSDYYSKKNIMIFGLFTQALFFFFYYFFAENIWIVYFARVIEIIGFMAITVVGFGALEDLIKKKRGSWTGIFLSFGTIGALTGPIIAGYISDYYQEKLLFLLGAGASLIAMFFLTFVPLKTTIKEKKYKKPLFKEINPLSEIHHFIQTQRMRGLAIMGLLMNARGQIFAIFFPIYLIKSLGFSETLVGILITIPIIMHLTQYFLGKISDSVSPQFGILTGCFFNCLALFFIPYSTSLLILIPLLLIMGTSASLWNVSAWSLMGKYAKENNVEGEISGTYFSLSKLGAFLATLSVSTILTFFSIGVMIQIFAVLVLVATCFVYFFLEPVFHHENTSNQFVKHFN